MKRHVLIQIDLSESGYKSRTKKYNVQLYGRHKVCSSLDKQRICVNTQLKSSKKQLKLNVCVPKSNSVDRYAFICDVIAYHLVHFVSICVIYKCQSGIDFFLLASAQYNFNFMNKISPPVKYFSGKTLQNGCKQRMSTRRDCSTYNKILYDTQKGRR